MQALDSPEALLDSPEALLDSPEALLDSPEALLDSPEALLHAPEAFFDCPNALLESPDALLHLAEVALDTADAIVQAPEIGPQLRDPPAHVIDTHIDVRGEPVDASVRRAGAAQMATTIAARPTTSVQSWRAIPVPSKTLSRRYPESMHGQP